MLLQVFLAKTDKGKPLIMCKLLRPWEAATMADAVVNAKAPAEGEPSRAEPALRPLLDADLDLEELVLQEVLRAGVAHLPVHTGQGASLVGTMASSSPSRA